MTSVTAGNRSRVKLEHLNALLSPVQLVLMDVDGVLTDGKFFFLSDPTAAGQIIETKGFDSQDGLALQWLREFNIPAGLISGRDSVATAERARTAGFQFVHQGHLEKTAILERIAIDSGIDPKRMLYIGDDLTDIAVMRRVRVRIAVANARPEVKKFSHFVTQAPGGAGAIREVVELILKAKGLWERVLQQHEVND